MKAKNLTMAVLAPMLLVGCGKSDELALKEKELEIRAQELELAKTNQAQAQIQAAQAPVVQPQAVAPAAVAPAPVAAGVAPSASKGGARVAYVFSPPSNVRFPPNGGIMCVLNTKGNINIYGYSNSTYDGGREVQWYYTDACGGRNGVIASTQFR